MRDGSVKGKGILFRFGLLKGFMTLWPRVSQSGIRKAFVVAWGQVTFMAAVTRGLVNAKAGCCVVLRTCFKFTCYSAWCTLFSRTTANCKEIVRECMFAFVGAHPNDIFVHAF